MIGTSQVIGASDGAAIVVLRSAAETGGEYTEVEVLFPPGAPPSWERAFLRHELRIEVLTGRLELTVDGEVRPLRAGEALTVAARVPYRIAVASPNGAARVLFRVRPALADATELERTFALAQRS
jgi:quercetin dioxygenase-like cupin family protein